jgi:hypothetical protein
MKTHPARWIPVLSVSVFAACVPYSHADMVRDRASIDLGCQVTPEEVVPDGQVDEYRVHACHRDAVYRCLTRGARGGSSVSCMKF